jgi:signal transduction histidine kinase
MNTLTKRCIALALVALMPLMADAVADGEKTLTRMTFWVPSEGMEEFSRQYEQQLLPLLVERGFVPSSVAPAAGADSVFQRIFERDALAGWRDHAMSVMMLDSTVHDVLRSMGVRAGEQPSFPPRPVQSGIREHYGLLSTPAGDGQVAEAGRGSQSWHTYDVADGLTGAFVGTIAQATDGAMWFANGKSGVAAGASRFDGQTWETLKTADGLAHDFVETIVAGNDGDVWFGYGPPHGVTRYDGTTWQHFTTKDGLPSDETLTLFSDRAGDVWVGTDSGVGRFDGHNWTSFTTEDGLASHPVNEVLQDAAGDLWFATGERGRRGAQDVSRYDGSNWSRLDTDDAGFNTRIRAMAQDAAGAYWFATDEGGLSRLQGEAWTDYLPETFNQGEWIEALATDARGNLWAVGFRGGVRRFDGQNWQTFTSKDGLVSDDVLAMTVDEEGSLWFGTYGAGVSRLDPAWTNYSREDGLPEDFAICLLLDRDGALWVGTNGKGVSRYDGDTWTTFTVDDGLSRNDVRSMYQDRDGDIWFGTNNGVSRYDGHGFRSYHMSDGLPGSRSPRPVYTQVLAILQDRNGAMWFGTHNGVSRFADGVWTTFTVQDGMAGSVVRAIEQDNEGALWFGAIGGVSRFDGADWTSFTTADGLVHDTVTDLHIGADGVLWVGTLGGLGRYDGESWQSFTRQNGLVADHVAAIHEDQQDVLWVGTQGGGVSRYDGRTFQTLTRQDGLGSNTVWDIEPGVDGDIWLATSAGVTRFQSPAAVSPGVEITAVVADRRYIGESALSLSSTIPLASFEFAGYSLKTRPGTMVYRYRLDGVDEAWQTTTAQRVEYEDLPVGDYAFEVVAIDRDLGYSAEPARLPLQIVYPLDRFAWIATLGLAVAFASWQTRRLVQRDRNLRATNVQLRSAQTQLVQAEKMSTVGLLAGGVAHEINNPLQTILDSARRIQLYPDDMKRHQQSASLVEQAAQRAAAIVRNLLDYTRASSGNVAPVDLNEVVNSTLALLQHHLDERGVQLHLEVAPVPSFEGNFNDLSTVVTNLVMNAADATRSLVAPDEPRIGLLTGVEGDDVLLTVRDNGAGIPAVTKDRIFDPFYTSKEVGAGTGLGLAIVQGVVERHCGRIELHSEPGRTEFIVRLPQSTQGGAG